MEQGRLESGPPRANIRAGCSLAMRTMKRGRARRAIMQVNIPDTGRATLRGGRGVVGRLIVRRPASRNPARDDPMAAAACCRRPGGRALARRPGDVGDTVWD
jgi:hypothetical protein